jgi:glycosyltransferase involved in cell wall biosynthesis
MKILLFDNSSLNIMDCDFSCEPKTGIFATELNGFGHEVTMFGQIVEADNTVLTYKLKEKGIRIAALKRRKNKIINYILLYLRTIPEIIKSDFIYIFYPNAFKYTAILCILFRKKYGLYIRCENNLEDYFSKKIYKKAFIIFTVSNFFTQMVNKISNRYVAHTIRPMIPYTDKDILWDRDYKEKEDYNILFLGRVAFDKGIEELLNAIKFLKEKNYKFHLTIVGNGEFMQRSYDLVDKLYIKEIVSFEGAVFDFKLIKDYYSQSDIYILPTYHEGFPRTLYEAMIFGTPIITTFVGGIPSVMKDGFNCKRIEPKSIESIVDGLEYAFSNYTEMIELARNGRNTVAKIVDSKRLTHVECLNQIINEINNNNSIQL